MSAHRKPPLPPSMMQHNRGFCRWCAGPVLRPDGLPGGTWHPKCVAAFKLIHWPAETREAVLKRDKGICARCGKDCVLEERRCFGTMQLDRWLMRSECRRLFGNWAGHWSHKESIEWLKRHEGNARAHYGFPPAGASFWQHDHIRPLIEANGDISFWQLSNIQTLCHACHVEKGKEDNARRRAAKRQLEPALL